MNHLGDANKMVSDTPRTDEAQFGTGRVSVSFVRKLERELNAANDRIKRLEEFARTIKNDFDHDEDAHRYGTTCRVCDAEDLLKETKAKEAKL
jgi:hypothetical protein